MIKFVRCTLSSDYNQIFSQLRENLRVDMIPKENKGKGINPPYTGRRFFQGNLSQVIFRGLVGHNVQYYVWMRKQTS